MPAMLLESPLVKKAEETQSLPDCRAAFLDAVKSIAPGKSHEFYDALIQPQMDLLQRTFRSEPHMAQAAQIRVSVKRLLREAEKAGDLGLGKEEDVKKSPPTPEKEVSLDEGRIASASLSSGDGHRSGGIVR